jgi:preprotein translocase subunit SecD
MPRKGTDLIKDPAFAAMIALVLSVVCFFLGIYYGRWTIAAASFAIGLSVVLALTQIIWGRAHNSKQQRHASSPEGSNLVPTLAHSFTP